MLGLSVLVTQGGKRFWLVAGGLEGEIEYLLENMPRIFLDLRLEACWADLGEMRWMDCVWLVRGTLGFLQKLARVGA